MFALFYPGPRFIRPDLIKNALLLFDGVALYAPAPLSNRQLEAAPWIAEPLLSNDLLRILTPREVVSPRSAHLLLDLLNLYMTDGSAREILTSVGQQLNRDWFARDEIFLASSRGGSHLSPEFRLMAKRVYSKLQAFGAVPARWDDELLSRGRGYRSVDDSDYSISMDFRLWAATISLQVLAICNEYKVDDIEFVPISQSVALGRSLMRSFMTSGAATRSALLAADLESLSVDLRLVPLQDVMDFREEHGSEYRKYISQLRTDVVELSHLDESELAVAQEERSLEKEEIRFDLMQRSRKEFGRRAASLSAGSIGAVVSAGQGSRFGSLAAILAGLAGATSSEEDVTAFTYLSGIQRSFRPVLDDHVTQGESEAAVPLVQLGPRDFSQLTRKEQRLLDNLRNRVWFEQTDL